MTWEPTPPSAAQTSSVESSPSDKWVDVCRCLIADTRTWTVKRLSLKRLVRLVPVIGQAAVTTGVTPGAAPLGMASRGAAVSAAGQSRYGNPYESSAQSSKTDGIGAQVAMSEIHLKEEWKEEVVSDLDEVLVMAMERVVSGVDAGVQSAAGSGTPSRASSIHRGRTGKGGDIAPLTPIVPDAGANGDGEQSRQDGGVSNTPTAGDVPRECREIVIGALESVVNSVFAERRRADVDAGDDAASAIRVSADGERDSSLREGVRKWLTEVEEGIA